MPISKNSQITTIILSPYDIQTNNQELLLTFLQKIKEKLQTELVIKFDLSNTNVDQKWEQLKEKMKTIEYRSEEEIQQILKEEKIIN